MIRSGEGHDLALPPPKRVEIGAFYSVCGDHGMIRSVGVRDRAGDHPCHAVRHGQPETSMRKAPEQQPSPSGALGKKTCQSESTSSHYERTRSDTQYCKPSARLTARDLCSCDSPPSALPSRYQRDHTAAGILTVRWRRTDVAQSGVRIVRDGEVAE